MNFETMNLNFRTLHSGAFAEQEGRGSGRRRTEERKRARCESCLLDLLGEIKEWDLFSMGGLLSPRSPAAPAWEMAFTRDR